MKQTYLATLLFLAMSAGGQIPNKLTAAEKVYGLSKFWQEVNYNFVYLDKVDRKSWDNSFKEYITIVQHTKNDYEYYRELQKFCALLKDGHTNIFFPPGIREMTTDFGEYRLFLENWEGKAIIVRTNAGKKEEIPAGSEIIEVNGMPTQKYIDEKVAPYIASSTRHVLQDESITGLLRGLEGETCQVKIKKPGGEIAVLKLTHKPTAEKELYPAPGPARGLLDFKWMGNAIAYISLNSFEQEQIDSLFKEKLPELYKAKSLIIDLRFNGGGSAAIGNAILQYFTNDSLLYGARTTTREHIATFKAWGTSLTAKDTLVDNPGWGIPREEIIKIYLMSKDRYYYQMPYEPQRITLTAKRLLVPTVILIGHNTASAAEDFLIAADNQEHMIKMGENTFGSTGQPYYFDLPGGGSARVCTKKDTYPDGREFVGVGIKPDIEVKKTWSDYIRGRDPVLEEAMDYLKQKLK